MKRNKEQLERAFLEALEEGNDSFLDGVLWADSNLPEGVVDLGKIWHLSTETPDPTNRAVCYCINDKYIFCVSCSKEVFLTTWKDILNFKDTESRMRWAYLDDLIKGIYNDK